MCSLLEKCPCSFLNALFHSQFPILPITQLVFCDPLSQSLYHWKSSLSSLISPSSSSSHVVSALRHVMATFYTHPSQNITAPHLYSSLQFSPCFILSYQTSSLPLFFSLLTLYQRYFDHQVSVLAPEQPRSLCPAFPQPQGCCSATLPSSSIATFAAISCPLPKVFSLLVNGISAPSLPHVTSMN